MLKGAEKIEKIFRRSKTIMTSSKTEPVEKANALNSYYASIFSSEGNNTEVQSTDSGKPFTVNVNIIKKRLSAIRRNK
jgi:hypothetical protein